MALVATNLVEWDKIGKQIEGIARWLVGHLPWISRQSFLRRHCPSMQTAMLPMSHDDVSPLVLVQVWLDQHPHKMGWFAVTVTIKGWNEQKEF